MTRVFLIDDEPDLRVMVKLFLEQEGDLEVTPAESAQEGLSSLAGSHFDAIWKIPSITDMRETGVPGEGSRFGIRIPEHRHRISGKAGGK
jgi:CheY-like chemotaxis protein